jgi:RNA polymerase sigma factor (sigma-70 family)
VEEYVAIATENAETEYLAAEKVQIQNSMVSRLLGFLSPRQRTAIELYYIEERKYEDICDIMQMNYQSVRNLIHRGMMRLRASACL